MIINEHWRVWRCYPVCLALFNLSLLTGCDIYLHDDDLQKQTDIALSTYKTADIVGAMKSALAAQEQLNKAELLAVAEKETADRERAIKYLISSYPETHTKETKHAIDRLDNWVSNRIEKLAGAKINPKDWLDYHEKMVRRTSLAAEEERVFEKMLRNYSASGGKKFYSCETFQGQDGEVGGSEELINKARYLKTQCENVARDQLPKKLKDLKESVLKSGGEIATVNQALIEVDNQLIEQTKNKNAADKQLKDAKKNS